MRYRVRYGLAMKEISERLRRARIEAGFESAAAACSRFGWTPTTYAGHENGSRGFSQRTAEEYARAFKMTPEWLLFGRTGDIQPILDDVALVPVYSVYASAGPGALVTSEEIVDRLAFPPNYLRHITKSKPEHLAIIGVKGDSMSPTLKDDDLVMIDTKKVDLSYDGLFVIRDGGEALLVKRIGRASRRGYVMIISDNKDNPPVERPGEDVEVVGKVIWAGVKV